MNVNLESGGIISESMKHVARYGEPLNTFDNTDAFERFAFELVRQRYEHDGERQEDMLRDLRQMNIGQIATNVSDLPSGRIRTVSLAMLGEAVGAMPDYIPSEKRVKKIGEVSIRLDSNQDTVRTPVVTRGRFDILTSGEVVAENFAIETEGPRGNDYSIDDIRLIGRLGLSKGWYSPNRRISYVANGHRTLMLKNQELDQTQIASLQTYLAESFPQK